jgi:hypothetical protein
MDTKIEKQLHEIDRSLSSIGIILIIALVMGANGCFL